jgi:hypothetical protein
MGLGYIYRIRHFAAKAEQSSQLTAIFFDSDLTGAFVGR